jgi:hypothetical protein
VAAFPAVPAPGDQVRVPVEVKLAPGWRFNPRRGRFEGEKGEVFAPPGDLPKKTKIVHKVPRLATAERAALSEAERDLASYLQVILPATEAPEKYLERIRAWPCIVEAHVGPRVSLPGRL